MNLTSRIFPLLTRVQRRCLALPTLLVSLVLPLSASAAAFSGNARIEIGDGLGWDPSKSALTVSCWFKLAIPTGTTLTENMTILVNRRSGDESNTHAYQVRFNISTGNIEFTARGTAGPLLYTNTLIERPYLERWYHVAVVRSADTFTGYLDGRPVFTESSSIGSSTPTDGVSIGGWGSGKFLYGEVQEFAVHDSALSQEFIAQYMFANQPAIAELKGYYKLGYSTNAADNLRNFAPAGPGPGGVVGSGKVEFEESNQGGEQSAFDSRRNGGRDSLAPLSGAFSWEQTVFARPTPGIAFDFRVGYSSANAFGGFKLGGTDPYASGPLGAGWRHTFETRVLPSRTFSPLSDTDTVGLMMWNGAIETWDFDYDTGNYRTRSKEYKGELTFPTLSTCQWTTPERIVYTFKAPDRGNNLVMRGRLISIRDFNSNTVELRWNETIGVITQVVDSARGVYDFSYNAQQLLSAVAFTNGPAVWLVNFGFDATNRLVSQSFTNTSGLHTNVNTLWQFAYNTTNGLLDRITDPRGLTNSTVQYDKYGRKTNQVDALGRATVTKFGSPGKRQITHVDPGTNSWVETYDRKHRLLSQTDPLGQTTSYTYDAAGNRLSITEPLGYTSYFGYDDRANVIAKTNAAGEVSRWSFHPFFNKATNDVNPLGWTNYFVYDDARGNLLRHYDGLGTLVTYTYETNGLVLVSVDANGNTSRSTYNTNGFLIAKTDPATNTTSFGLNEVGWKLAETNALGQVAAFAYDLNGRAVLAVDSLLRRFTNVFDASGNLLSANDGKGQLTRNFYDAANQKTQTVDRAGSTNLFFYTTRGKLDRATDALGNTATNFYDTANRLIRVSDPLGNTVTNAYDANGNLIAFLDQVGQRFTKSYDRLNRVIAESDPLGNTRRTTFDAAGRVSQVLTPNGYPSTHTYDGRGRLTQWVDAENFRWFYDYDPVGHLPNITDALAGRYVMTYGSRNERLSELNQDGKLWTYAYDPLLRLSRQTDPNSTARNLSYDVAGRVLSVGFSTLRTNSFNYDINNNPTNVSRLYQGTTTSSRLTYDVLDRATNQMDAFFQTVGYAYDALGRMTNLVYPGGKALAHRYDALGRLTNQVDWLSRPMNYAYDRAGRLVSRAYPNGVVQTNTFDTAGRLTSLSYLTNSTAMIALTYAYDRNGNKNFMGEKGTFAWPQPTLTDDKSRFTPAGRLIDREVETSTANPPTNSYSWAYRYDASGNLTNATGGGQAYTLAYDEDNRTTSIAWDNGLTAKIIANRYDALGRRISRTLDGATTGYVLSLVGGMERILCDLNPDSAFTYYVHGPDLAYKEAADGTVTYYHADAQANIISLTAASTATVAQYAYTPYGRSLGSTNSLPALSSQPFNFVGSQGVMEELPGLYFMRARYYSSEAGTFISTDPVKAIGPGWKAEAYAYANGNPLSNIDPEGEFAHVLIGAGVGALISGAQDVLAQAQDDGLGSVDWNHVRMKAASGGIKGTIAAVTGGISLLGEIGFGVADTALDIEYSGQSHLDNMSSYFWAAGTASFSHAVSGGAKVRGAGRSITMDRGLANFAKNAAGPNSIRGIQEGVLQKTISTSLDLHFNTLPNRAQTAFSSAGSSQANASAQVNGGSQSLSGRAADASSYAQNRNAYQSISPAPAFNMARTTPMYSSGGSSGSGSSSFANLASSVSNAASKAGNSITQSVKNAATSVGQAISNTVSAVGNFFSSVFGGGGGSKGGGKK